MAMQAESLEVLEKAELPPPQARAIVRAIEIEIEGAKDVLATKNDVVLLRSDWRQEATVLRSEMAVLRTELRAEMRQMSHELQLRIETKANSLMWQMYSAMAGHLVVVLGIVYFVVAHFSR